MIKENILVVLNDVEITHMELMKKLYEQVKYSFDGCVRLYGEKVKLNLEARKIIEHTGKKPDTYCIRKK
jgi:hypothetical protein